MLSRACFVNSLIFVAIAAVANSQTPPVTLDVDATDAARKILHARLTIPAEPGQLTLVYPKWIPGTHGPTGPITDLAGLKITAAGHSVPWQRDAEDLYAFHVDVPKGAKSVEVSLDSLLAAGDEGLWGASATAQLLALNWNLVVLYPKGSNPHEIKFAATLKLPAGWKYGTALPLARESADGLEFAPVSLETLIDSPLITGAHFRTVDLSPGTTPAHVLHIVADSAAALEIKTNDVAHFSHLVAEADALFGARHYRSYQFLLTLSDHVSHFGLEHHESSDNRIPERALIDESLGTRQAGIMPHEVVHSWNGKYRRPADLATPDYQQPMKTDLLWVYEGLTTYLGQLLTARSGLWTNETYREDLAWTAARLDTQVGRTWRPLADTTVAAPLLMFMRGGAKSWRRSADYYPEGWLIWLEADIIIRQKTAGKRSLDDFCKRFFGGTSGPPIVVTYTFDDVVAALNEIARHDWREFFNTRVNAINPRPPLGGIEGGGWRLVYTDVIPDVLKTAESADKFTDLRYSLGLLLKEEGLIDDVIPGSPADKAGVSTGMKLIAVNGRHYKPEILRIAVKEAKTTAAPIELLTENAEYYKTFPVDYHGGEKYPHLERDSSKPDLLDETLKPLTP